VRRKGRFQPSDLGGVEKNKLRQLGKKEGQPADRLVKGRKKDSFQHLRPEQDLGRGVASRWKKEARGHQGGRRTNRDGREGGGSRGSRAKVNPRDLLPSSLYQWLDKHSSSLSDKGEGPKNKTPRRRGTGSADGTVGGRPHHRCDNGMSETRLGCWVRLHVGANVGDPGSGWMDDLNGGGWGGLG